MTADRWGRIESGLWRLFENLKHWQEAYKLDTDLLIDHINVRVQGTQIESANSSAECGKIFQRFSV